MSKHLQPLLTFLFIGLLISSAKAQVDEPTHTKYCHHSTHNIEKRPLSQAEQAAMVAGMERSDTFDLFHIAVNLEIINFNTETINGYADISFTSKMDDIPVLPLDLRSLNVDSIILDGVPVTFDYDDFTLNVNLPSPIPVGEIANVRVYYNGHPATDPSFGGLDFDNGVAYNLGIGINSTPYNYGSGWFPCFDNFVERQTFEFNIKTANNRVAYCTGTFLGQTTVSGDTILRSYFLDQPIPTYLAGVAVSSYTEVNQVYETAYGPLPFQLVANPNDTTIMKSKFSTLGACVDAIESWYGPYQWERVGYVATPNGAMEHPTNIAYPRSTITNGSTAEHNRLMAHELAHCWWGDVVTLTSPANMWIKEGNAEYGAHLFTLHLDGQEAFINQVKRNFIETVLKKAHYDDDSYLPLSGIPYEYTYGTHTYFKGASMLHNLRGYLGDELFSAAQTNILETYAFSAIDAEMYRDQLTLFTGIDMTSFFQDWIFSPGFAGYEFDALTYTPVAGGYQVDMTIGQKLRGAPAFHTNTPIDVTCIDQDMNRYTEQIMVSGEATDVSITAPFEPVATFLNGDHKLNIANVANEVIITEPGNYTYISADFEVIAETVPSDAWVRVEHCWIPPDVVQNPEPGTRVSKTHYWKVDTNQPEGFLGKGVFRYRGPALPELDLDLVPFDEDSILLVYRKDASEEWRIEPQTKMAGLPTDREGVIQADSLISGEYAFAVGVFEGAVSTDEIYLTSKVAVSPNPTTEFVTVSGTLSQPTSLIISLTDVGGQEIVTKLMGMTSDDWSLDLQLNPYPNGIYFIEIKNNMGQVLSQEKVIKATP